MEQKIIHGNETILNTRQHTYTILNMTKHIAIALPAMKPELAELYLSETLEFPELKFDEGDYIIVMIDVEKENATTERYVHLGDGIWAFQWQENPNCVLKQSAKQARGNGKTYSTLIMFAKEKYGEKVAKEISEFLYGSEESK